MKKFLLPILLLLFLASCKYPEVVNQDGMRYKIINWKGGEFYYVTYYWNGGKFDDAIDLINEFDRIKNERGLDELAIGRFPASKEWQFGFIAKEPLKIKEIKGYKIEKMIIPNGKYASLVTKGYPESIFIYWKKFRTWLEADNITVNSTVFEIYEGAFDKNIPVEERRGELRYQIAN